MESQAPAGAKDFVTANITGTADLKDLADVDFVIESVVENMDIKKQVYKDLGEILRPEVIVSSNTSSLSITEIAAAYRDPTKVVGMHFFTYPGFDYLSLSGIQAFSKEWGQHMHPLGRYLFCLLVISQCSSLLFKL
jgi:hypothetical protein